jgi:wyosine [tRNA(Phe)-imidazoG37] synthetase (radical SAM superfamily)
MALPLLDRIVYGPVRSRRLGTSLGVNLLPPGFKVCNMNCAYCQYGSNRRRPRAHRRRIAWPTAPAVEAALSARLLRAAHCAEMLDRITVAGHGEPTLHPEFEEVAARLCAVRDRLAPGLPIAILSNSTTATASDVGSGLARFDERYMKLDAADSITCARLNGPGISVTRVIDALATLAPVTIEAMFVKDACGDIDNTTSGVVHEWLEAIERIGAARVHIYTVDRQPALESLRPVSLRRLCEIAERVRAAGMAADVFAPSPRKSAPVFRWCPPCRPAVIRQRYDRQ